MLMLRCLGQRTLVTSKQRFFPAFKQRFFPAHNSS